MNEQPPMIEPVDIRQTIGVKKAIERAELWASWGFPTSKPHMPQHEYDRDYVGRIWFCAQHVLDQAQEALKIILCPNCVKEDKRGGISATRFYITVEDDVMTTFPAVGHFLCHHCGFEEWHPLKHDPRTSGSSGNDVFRAQHHALMQQGRDAMMRSMGPLGAGAMQSEVEALQRLYNNHMKNLPNTIANPPIYNPILSNQINKKP